MTVPRDSTGNRFASRVASLTLRYLAILPYWLGRAHRGVGQTSAALEHFKAFVALRQTATLDDPLVADARRRAGL